MKPLLTTFILTLLLTGCTTAQNQPTDQNPINISTSTSNEQQAKEPQVEPPHPVSLQALSQKEFDGRNLELGQVLADNTAYTRYYITYKSGDLDISGIMNVPKGEGPFPVLILNHGYIDPAVYTNGRGLKREQDYLARQGYIVIHPDYRNHASSSTVEDNHLNLRLGYTEDVINAVYAVRASSLDYIDKQNIGMMGHSMGGGITLNILVAKPDLLDAAVLYAPVSSNYVDNFNKWTRDNENADQILATYGEPSEEPDFWNNMSPANFIDQIQTPIMIHHGTLDDSTPIEWSNELHQNLEEEGKNVTYHVYEGEVHEFVTNWPIMMQRNAEFYDEYLKG